ncbi:MAG: tRNA (adenosine(37)-N6)-threonylcarbamoyltransferase complex dimerization subunit type 1 TsaB [Pseudomonadota bacterium]
MRVLAIHTAGPACDIALMDGKHVLCERFEQMSRGQDARLPGLVQQVCDDAQIRLNELDRIAVVTGPGSFTGVRVGVAFARGLALVCKVPCVGVTSLEAALPQGQQGSAIVLLPAQKRPPDITFWAQRFRSGLATGPAEEIRLDTLQNQQRAHPHMIYGDADILAMHLPDTAIRRAQPTARGAAQVGARLDPMARIARPTYARAPDATPPALKA